MDAHKGSIRKRAIELREAGHSLGEIARKLNISKSTASLWLRATTLNSTVIKRINSLKKLARQKASLAIHNNHLVEMEKIRKKSSETVKKIKLDDVPLSKVFCSLLYWGEGGKVDNHITFINSDPKMIRVFLKLFRKSFIPDESKFRALVHIHEYHDETQVKNYWSKITKIPLQKFSKSYLKPHTGKSIRNGFMGTIKIKYFDSKIVYELKAIYNTLADSI